MKYIALDNNTAILAEWNPLLYNEEITLSFVGVSDGYTAAIECGGNTWYRTLRNGCVSFPSANISGVVKITVADLESISKENRWVCDELVAERTASGVLLYPDHGDLRRAVADLKMENANFQRDNKEIHKKIKAIEDRLSAYLEGYDLT